MEKTDKERIKEFREDLRHNLFILYTGNHPLAKKYITVLAMDCTEYFSPTADFEDNQE